MSQPTEQIELTKMMKLNHLPTLKAKQRASEQFGLFYNDLEAREGQSLTKKKLGVLEQTFFDENGNMRFATFNDKTVEIDFHI